MEIRRRSLCFLPVDAGQANYMIPDRLFAFFYVMGLGRPLLFDDLVDLFDIEKLDIWTLADFRIDRSRNAQIENQMLSFTGPFNQIFF